MKYIYFKIGARPSGIYRFPTAKTNKGGEYWNGSEWVEGVARTVKDAKARGIEGAFQVRRLTLKQAQNLIFEITNR